MNKSHRRTSKGQQISVDDFNLQPSRSGQKCAINAQGAGWLASDGV